MIRVFENENFRSFRYTDGQLKILRSCLPGAKRNPGKEEAHTLFLEHATNWTGIWLSTITPDIFYDDKGDIFELTNCDLQPRKKVYSEHMKDMSKLISELKSYIENLPLSISSSFNASLFDVTYFKSPSNLRDTIRYYRHSAEDSSTKIGMPDELLFDLLSIFDKAARQIKDESVDKGSLHNPAMEFLVETLARKYEQTYNKKPSYFANTIFVKFITAVADIFSLNIGEDSIKSVLLKSRGTN